MIRVVHPGSRILMLTFFHPGSRIQGSKSTQSRIRIRNTDRIRMFLGLPDPDLLVRHGSGSFYPFYCQARIIRKTSIPKVL